MKSDCIFCQIAAGQTSARLLYHDELVSAFADIQPAAPVHLLLVPNRHIESVGDLAAEDEAILGRMSRVAGQLAAEAGLQHSGYRLIINTGPDAGQTVFHLHMHLLGGQRLGGLSAPAH